MRKRFFLWLFLFIFLTTYSYHSKQNSYLGFFSIKKIEIQGINYTNQENLERSLEIIKNKNIIFLNNNDLKTIVKKIDFVNSLKIKKIYPDKIIISVIEDNPIGIYINQKDEKYLLLENNKTIKGNKYEFKNLPNIYGEGAMEKFSDFYSVLKKTNFNTNIIKEFNYYYINRWDLLLKDGKLIKLPPENYEKSVTKFLEIYEKSTFKKFKVYDFRIENELIMR